MWEERRGEAILAQCQITLDNDAEGLHNGPNTKRHLLRNIRIGTRNKSGKTYSKGKVLTPVTIATTENPGRLGSDELPGLDATSFVWRGKSSECKPKRKVSRWNSLGRSERNGRDVDIGLVGAGSN